MIEIIVPERQGVSTYPVARSLEALAFVHLHLLYAVENNSTDDSNIIAIVIGDSVGRWFVIELEGHVAFRLGNDNQQFCHTHFAQNTMKDAVPRAQRIFSRLLKVSGNVVTMWVVKTGETLVDCWRLQGQLGLPLTNFPVTEETAYQELLACFHFTCPSASDRPPLRVDCDFCDDLQDRILEILKNFPSLASRGLEFDRHPVEEEEVGRMPDFFNGATPLCCLLGCPFVNPRLEVVKAVYEMYPQAVEETNGKRSWTAMHMVFATRPCSESVVEFIRKKNPSAMFRVVGQYHDSPVSLLLRGINMGTMHLSTLNLLLLRQCLTDVLSEAIWCGCSEAVLSLIVKRLIAQRYPAQEESFLLGIYQNRGPIRFIDANALQKVVPRLSSLVINTGSGRRKWSRGSLELLLGTLATGPIKLVRLFLSTLPVTVSTGNLWKLVISHTVTLRYLDLRFDETATNVEDHVKKIVAKGVVMGLVLSENLDEVELEGFPCCFSWEDLLAGDEFDANNKVLRQLKLCTKNALHESFVPGLLAHLPSISRLELEWTSRKSDDTASVAEKLIDILEEYNTSLEDIVCKPYLRTYHKDLIGGQTQRKLDYFLGVNFYGRKTVRDSCTTKKNFVEILERANARHGEERRYEATTHNILHGLLRERPGLWSV